MAPRANAAPISVRKSIYQAPDAKLEPRLVAGHEISSDGLDYTLKLRQGVKFSDGTPYDAKALKLTFDRAMALNRT